MKLKELRAELPLWEWRAVREGMGWIYEGTKGDRKVLIRPYAMLVGEDDFETQWRVSEISASKHPVSEPYAHFWIMEG